MIGLIGPLGAGKTVFVKGLASGLGVAPRLVSSPTFVIAQQYPLLEGPRVLHHLDFYRLESERELDTVGFDDMLARGAVLAVEWADRFPAALGPERLEIELEGPGIGDGREGWEEAPVEPRTVRVRAHGPEAERVLADWAARVDRLGLAVRESEPRDQGAGSEGEPDGGSEGRDVVARMLAALLLAAGLTGLGRLGPGDPLPVCRLPQTRTVDALGVERVDCEVGRAGLPTRAGLGGLLFGQPLDLNAASAPLLEALPGIGPARARAILAERDQALFEDVIDLERVPGIGSITRARLEEWVRVHRVPLESKGAEGARNDG